jgi:hypothetical protein
MVVTSPSCADAPATEAITEFVAAPPAVGSPPRDRQRQVLFVVVVGLVLSTLILAGWFNRSFQLPSPATWTQGRLLSQSYDPPTRPVELLLNQGDGQAFAHHAQDPFIRHPEGIRGPAEEQAYRLQRPLFGWLGWAASGGDPGRVAWALMVLIVVSVGAFGGVAAWGCGRFGVSPLWGLFVFAAPGVLDDLLRGTPEVLGAALAGAGLVWWLSARPQRWAAVACFAVAGMVRETMLLVPVALFASSCWEARPRRRPVVEARRREPMRPEWRLLLPVVPYVVWVLVLRVGLGAWPTGTVSSRLVLVPFSGAAAVWGGWGLDEAVSLTLLGLPVIVAFAVSRHRPLLMVVAAHLVAAAVFGQAVWLSAHGFARVLLPMSLAAVLAIAARARPGEPSETEPVITTPSILDAAAVSG